MLLAALVGVLGSAQAAKTPLQLQVLADQASIKNMNMSERRAFRKNLFGNMTTVEKAAYRTATKNVAVLQGEVKVKANNPSRRVPGTNITYDTGSSMGTPVGTDTFTQGNRFDEAFNPAATVGGGINPVEATGSITAVTWLADAVRSSDSAAFITLISNLDGAPNQVATVGFGGVPTGTLLSVSRTDWNYANGPFLVGMWQGSGGNAGADVGSVNGQGFHGLEAASTGASATSLGNVNMIMRVTGNVLRQDVPVELMNFSVE